MIFPFVFLIIMAKNDYTLLLSSLLDMQGSNTEVGPVQRRRPLLPGKYTVERSNLIHHDQIRDRVIQLSSYESAINDNGNSCVFFY